MNILILFYILMLAVISGIAGRLGGSAKNGDWFDWMKNTNTRDIGCSLILIAVIWLILGLDAKYWLAYTSTAVFTFGSFRTYWDRLFGYDCHWFSGLVCGIAAFPLIWVDPVFIWIVPVRAVILAMSWHLLNKEIPQQGVLGWRRDVVEEFSRYFISL